MERNTFEFDGGMARFTITGAVLATLFRLVFWTAIAVLVLIATVLLTFELAAAFAGFHPIWRL